MTEKKAAPRPILEKIYDEMFNEIERKKIFSKTAIQKLKELAFQDNFKKERSIIEVIELEKREEDEIKRT